MIGQIINASVDVSSMVRSLDGDYDVNVNLKGNVKYKFSNFSGFVKKSTSKP